MLNAYVLQDEDDPKVSEIILAIFRFMYISFHFLLVFLNVGIIIDLRVDT